MAQQAFHQTIFALDVDGLGRLERGHPIRVGLRASLYHLLHQALDESAIDWKACRREDRGDGMLLLADPATPKARFVDPLLGHLRAGLEQHNRAASELARIRVRVALHAGEVVADEYGYGGEDLDFAVRLLGSAPLREALAASAAPLALIVSDAIYHTVVAQGYGTIEPSAYRPVRVQAKGEVARAWVHVPGPPERAPRPDGAGVAGPGPGA